ncbi:hypothetical protein DINM_005585 [Dirofilaria immitis]|nr:hypothetical protein [Dirofilaria immitis]
MGHHNADPLCVFTGQISACVEFRNNPSLGRLSFPFDASSSLSRSRVTGLRESRGGGLRETFLGGGLLEFADLRDTGDLSCETLRPRETDRLSLYREPLRLRVEERRRRGDREHQSIRTIAVSFALSFTLHFVLVRPSQDVYSRISSPHRSSTSGNTAMLPNNKTPTRTTTTTTTTAAVNCYTKQQLSQPIFP